MTGCIRKINTPINQVQPVATAENIQDNLCMDASINVGSENIQDNLCMDASINVASENIQDNLCMDASINVG
jgi:hypothetical protein